MSTIVDDLFGAASFMPWRRSRHARSKSIEFGELMTVAAPRGVYWRLLNLQPRIGPLLKE